MSFENLNQILDEIFFYMKNLEPVLEREQLLLSTGRIDGSLLQGATQQKEMLLAAISSLDKRRVIVSNDLGIEPPYETSPLDSIPTTWKLIVDVGEKLNRKNLNNGVLLQYHINFTKSSLEVLQMEAGSDIYGPNGQSKSGSVLGRKITI